MNLTMKGKGASLIQGAAVVAVASLVGSEVAMAGADTTFNTALTSFTGFLEGSGGKIITVLSLAGGIVGLASGRFSLGQVAIPVGVGVGAGTEERTERLAEAGIEPSVGSVGDSYDNALAETINGLFKAEVIHRRGPWRNFEAVEYATLEWVDWFYNRRLLEPIGNIPPAEAEANFYAALETEPMAA